MNERVYDNYISIDTWGKSREISILCAAVFMYFTRYSFLSFARSFSISTTLVGVSMMGLFFVLLFIHTVQNPGNIPVDGILLLLFVPLFFAVTLRLHPEYAYRFEDAYHNGRFSVQRVFVFGAGIYYYYLTRLFQRYTDKLYDLFYVIAYVILFFDTWAAFLRRSEEYSMGFGYQMEMAAIIFLAAFLENHSKKICLFLSLFCIGFGVLYGSRACLIGYALFFIVYLFWKRRLEAKQILLGSLALLAAAAVSIPELMKAVYKMFSAIGFQSRTLYMLAHGNIMGSDTSRQERLWPAVIQQLREMPWYKGMGAYGDRTLYSTYYGYCHNFVLEILATFGILLGGIFLIWMLVSFIKTIKVNTGHDGLMTVMVGCFVLAKLSVSNTFWQEPYFWMFLALLVNCGWQRRHGSYQSAAPKEKTASLKKSVLYGELH